MLRVFNPFRTGSTPETFRTNGPRARFDHQYPDTKGAPQNDPTRGILYGAPKGPDAIRACLMEVFGDSPGIDLGWHLGRIEIRRDLRLLDLRGKAAWGAGTPPQVSATDFPRLSQAWSRYFYEQTNDYGLLDGLIYQGALSGTDSIALYERAASGIGCSSPCDFPLDQPPLLDEVLRIAHETGLRLL